jgi:hypothetical protein
VTQPSFPTLVSYRIAPPSNPAAHEPCPSLYSVSLTPVTPGPEHPVGKAAMHARHLALGTRLSLTRLPRVSPTVRSVRACGGGYSTLPRRHCFAQKPKSYHPKTSITKPAGSDGIASFPPQSQLNLSSISAQYQLNLNSISTQSQPSAATPSPFASTAGAQLQPAGTRPSS